MEFSIDASPLVDVGTVAGAITPRLEALERRLLDCGSPAALQRRLENELLLGAATRRAPPSRVRAAVGRLGQPSVRVDTVADELGLTPRSLHREIVAWTGLGPKQLMRILRLQATLARLRARSEPLAVLAMEAGYADQAHMTREFRALAGATPHWFNGRPIRSRQRTSGG